MNPHPVFFPSYNDTVALGAGFFGLLDLSNNSWCSCDLLDRRTCVEGKWLLALLVIRCNPIRIRRSTGSSTWLASTWSTMCDPWVEMVHFLCILAFQRCLLKSWADYKGVVLFYSSASSQPLTLRIEFAILTGSHGVGWQSVLNPRDLPTVSHIAKHVSQTLAILLETRTKTLICIARLHNLALKAFHSRAL